MDVSPTNILIVDDDFAGCKFIEAVLSEDGHVCKIVQNPHQALTEVREGPVHIAFIDLVMPRMDGIELLRRVKEIDPETVVFIITGYGSVKTAIEAMKLGAFDYLQKPFTPDVLRWGVRKALEARSLRAENLFLRKQMETYMEDIVGQSPAMQEMFRTVERVAGARSTVLIRGESGTGKELIARAIHRLSPRRDRPFIAINCGSLSENLLESELFGHMRGAFTGAVENKPGLFEIADGGTFFLDEVCDITHPIQGKLLRVLQEREFKRLGGTKTVKVDVRIISATNKDIEKQIADGLFREDLFYRLSTVPIRVPPLRERPGDVALIAAHFLKIFCAQNNKKIKGFSPHALNLLNRHSWPGNVRELENAIERAVILCDGGIIPPEAFAFNDTGDSAGTGGIFELPFMEAKDKILSDFTIAYLKNALIRNQGNISHCSVAAGMDRRNFQKLVKKFVKMEKPTQETDPSPQLSE